MNVEPENRNPKLKILLVEDNPDDAELLREILLKGPSIRFELTHCERLSEALKRLKEESFDVIVSDLGLPDSQGFETFQKIHHQAPGSPIVVLTGLDDETVGIKIVHEGAEDYLIKGQISGDLLVRTLRYAIERKKIEEDLRRARDELEIRVQERTAELRESEERFRAIFESTTDCILIWDKNYNYLYANKAAIDHVETTRDKVIGKNIRDGLGHIPDFMKLWMGRIDQIFEIQNPMQVEDSVPVGDKFVYSESILSPIRDSHGNMFAVGVVYRDITERKRAEEEKAILQEQFRQSQKMEAIGKLAGGIAHDFNNLLTIIKGNSQLSLMEIKKGDPLRENIEQVEKAADRAAALTRQLLAFSRRQVLETKVLDLNTILRDLEKMLRRVIGEDIGLATLLAENLGTVKADPGQIEQVVMNLAVNARDAMLKGGKLTIETTNVELDENYARNHVAVKPGPYVMLSVSDTGVGMSPEVKAKIFEPFFTTKEKGKGTGLGLSTVYGIVKQSEGNIWVYSEPGKGTTFKIYLPQVDEPPEEVGEKVVQKELLSGSETILVVEDEEKVRQVAVQILTKNGYTVLEASHGDEAKQICEQHGGPIHLIVTDVVLPGMSGRELADCLASRHPGVKVLYMSGYTDDAIVHHGVLEKGLSFLQKPFNLEDLLRKVREVLDK